MLVEMGPWRQAAGALSAEPFYRRLNQGIVQSVIRLVIAELPNRVSEYDCGDLELAAHGVLPGATRSDIFGERALLEVGVEIEICRHLGDAWPSASIGSGTRVKHRA